jgi:phosphonopyruvate decarboxylase
MIDQTLLFNKLEKLNIVFLTGVPDSLLNDFCLYAEANLKKEKHIIAANEGNAVALAVGHHIATGKTPLVYMQNSGIGNAMNPLLSLAHETVYSIPMILLIGWRGGDSSGSDWVQHKRQGELTTVLMDDMNIPYRIVEDEESVIAQFSWAAETAKALKSPVALVVRKGILAKTEKDIIYPNDNTLLSREEAMDVVLGHLPKDTLYVATTGRATRELIYLKQKRGIAEDTVFLNVGAMGHASSIALGISLGQPGRNVVCFDGDSAAIMHLGALTTVGKVKPSNFLHIVLNNGVHESVGGQRSAGQDSDLTTIAKGAGYFTVDRPVMNKQEVLAALDVSQKTDGPVFMDIHICQGIRKEVSLLNISHIEMKERLMEEMGENESK